MRILLFGSTGQVGYDLIPYIKDMGELVCPTREECNFAMPFDVKNYIIKIKPDMIINAAAYTDVDKAEEEQLRAILINTLAVKRIAQMARILDIPLIHYSTDYVFDGKKKKPYTEKSKPSPTNIYGESKLKGDQAILKIKPKGVIFRTSWVYSNRRKNFFKTIRKYLEQDKPVKVISDQMGCPTSSRFIARITSEYIKTEHIKKPINIVNLVCDGEASWYTFALEIWNFCLIHGGKKYKKAQMPVDIKTTEEYITTDEYTKARVKRPTYSVLDNTKLKKLGFEVSSWQQELARMIATPTDH